MNQPIEHILTVNALALSDTWVPWPPISWTNGDAAFTDM
jgi:hypothetical protein